MPNILLLLNYENSFFFFTISDAERKERVRQIFSEASLQQSELNAMSRKKKHM